MIELRRVYKYAEETAIEVEESDCARKASTSLLPFMVSKLLSSF